MKTIRLILAASFVAFAAPAQADTFVLVHGAFQDAQAWDGVVERLERAGHTAIAVNLPGRGGEAAQSQTLQGYRDAVLAVVCAQPEAVILVGHSFGGMTISEVAEAEPDRIDRLIYVAAYLPRSGESLQTLSGEDHDNRFTQENFVLAPDYSTARVLERDAALIFANDVRGARQTAIAQALRPEPLAPMATPAALTPDRFGRVPRFYVRTLRDNAVSYALQTLMVERTPVVRAYRIDSGHAPQLTHPRRLAHILLQASRAAIAERQFPM